jgi:hypothetical protein
MFLALFGLGSLSDLSPLCDQQRTSAAIGVSTVSKRAGAKTVLESEAAKTVRLVRNRSGPPQLASSVIRPLPPHLLHGGG